LNRITRLDKMDAYDLGIDPSFGDAQSTTRVALRIARDVTACDI
jgi:hypothetical protein